MQAQSASGLDATQQTNGDGQFTGDRPISSQAEDRLGRIAFSQALGRAISSWKENESLIIALYGSWGSGKSSVKNLALEHIRELGAAAPDYLEFNPWQWHGHDGVTAAFFGEVLRKLDHSTASDRSRAVAKQLRRYAAFLGIGSVVLGGPKGFAASSIAVFGLLSLGTPYLLSDANAVTFAQILGGTAVAIAALMAWGQGTLERAAGWLDLLGSTLSLEEHKKNVASAMRERERPLLMVIDDIDRLSSTEIQSVFQLVKANADFPKFVYLLVFQRDIVEAALAEVVKERGAAYLEKIVQVGFDVPGARQEDIDSVLFEGLDRALGPQGAAKINQGRWGNLYYGSLRPYFEDLRDVKRFLGSVGFQISLLRSRGELDANPEDLIAIETVRVFEPILYHRLKGRKEILTGGHSSDDREEKATEIKGLLEGVSAERHRRLTEFLKEVFPMTAFAFGGTNYGSDFRITWAKQLRVCSGDFFDRYFQLGLAKEEVSQYEVNMLLDLSANAKALTRELKRLASEGRLAIALDRFTEQQERIEPRNMSSVLTALFDVGEVLPKAAPGFFALGSEWSVQRIAYHMLKRVENQDEREAILEQALNDSVELSMPVMRVSLESNVAERKKQPDAYMIREESLPRFQQLCVKKIKAAVSQGRLLEQRDLARILYRWLEWSSAEEVRGWVKSMTISEHGALAVLRAFVQQGTSQTFGDHVARVHTYIKLSQIEKFVDLESLERTLAEVSVSKLRDVDRQALDAFRKAMAAKRAGKIETEIGFED